MRLRVNQLQSVVKGVVKDTRSQYALRDELFRVLGPPIMISESPEAVFKCANEHLDVLEGTGRMPPAGSVKPSTLLEAAATGSVAVRKLAARLLPEQSSRRFLTDNVSAVRCAAAARAPYGVVVEAVRRFPKDDQLRVIARHRRLQEAGMSVPEEATPLDHTERSMKLIAVAKGLPTDDMPKDWYKRLAHKLCKEYGTNLEGQWEEILAKVTSAAHASYKFNVDRDLLLQSIYDHLKDREEQVIGESYLQRQARLLREGSDVNDDAYTEAYIPAIPLDKSPVEKLVETSMPSIQYIDEFERMFQVRKSTLPPGFKKYVLGESHNTTNVPVLANLPMGKLSYTEETALDNYVSKWNERQATAGEHFRISWSPHPMDISMVGFKVELK